MILFKPRTLSVVNDWRPQDLLCCLGPTGIHGGETNSIMLLRILLKKGFNCLTRYSSFFHVLTLQPHQLPSATGRCREIPQPEKIIQAGQRQKLAPGWELLFPRILKTLIGDPNSFLKSPNKSSFPLTTANRMIRSWKEWKNKVANTSAASHQKHRESQGEKAVSLNHGWTWKVRKDSSASLPER